MTPPKRCARKASASSNSTSPTTPRSSRGAEVLAAGRPDRRARQQRRHRLGGRDRGVHRRPGQAGLQHQRRRRAAHHPRHAAVDAEAGDGLIVNIGSILGRVTFPFFGVYGASKFAVEALTDSLRYEVSQFGVDVVLVQPSAYPTNMYAAIQQPADADVSASYGEIGAIPGKMFETFMDMFAARERTQPA